LSEFQSSPWSQGPTTARQNPPGIVYEFVRGCLCGIQGVRRIVPIVKTVDQGGNSSPESQHLLGGIGCDLGFRCSPRRVTVVHTTTEGTIAALRAAADLAKDLGAEVVLLSAEEVPPQFRLDKLPVPVDLLERRLHRLVYASGIRGNEVVIQLLLCRKKFASLRRNLRPGSVVVMGENKHWWSRRSQKLQRFLKCLGHQVVFAASPRTKCFQRDWDREALVIRGLVTFGDRRTEI
jgi:hypothetical protein